jgi:signal transduction histidine kinase
MRRRAGVWWFVPTARSAAAGVVVLHHPDATTLDALREPLVVAVHLLQPDLVVGRVLRETERRIEERTSELALFYETSRALVSATTAEEIASLIGQNLGRALGLDVLGLLALHPQRHELFLEVSGSASLVSLRLFRRSILRQAGAAMLGDGGRPVTVRINRWGRSASTNGLAEGSEVHLPLSIQGRTVGMLAARTLRGSLSESQMRLIYTLSSQAALTLERVRSVEEAGLLKMRAVLDSMSEGVLLVDRGLRVILANPAAQRHAEAVLGGKLQRRLVRLGEVSISPLVEALASGDAPSGPIEIVSEDPPRIFHLTASPAFGLKGSFEGAVLVLRDATHQRLMQEQLHQTEKLSSLGEMISGVAHELNNPLAAVIGFAQLLDQRDLDPDVRQKVAAISNEASRCHSIVQNLLRFARKQAPERRSADLNSVIGSVVQLLGYQLQADNIAVDVDLDRDMRPILADFHALQQVFVNIVHNAHQAMREKGGRGLLRIVTRCDGLSCRAEVSDTGPGIKSEHLKRIFDPFFSTKGVGQGTGLGLSIAYGTIKDHGGDIQVRSRIGRGCTFVVEIPAIAGETAVSVPAESEAVAVEPPSARGRRILVVEDEGNLAEMLCEALSAKGHYVESASDGRTAKEMLLSGRFDLIISDLKMPNMGGRELYDAVFQMDPTLARRIIFSTGDTVSADTQAFFDQVGNPFLVKPFNLRDLYRIVNTALGGA